MSKPSSPILFAVLSVGVLVAGAGLSYAQYGKVQQLTAKANAARQELGSRAELEAQLAQSSLDVQKASQDLTHLEGNLTTVEYVPTLLKDLQTTGESCHLQIEGVRPVPKNDAKVKKPEGTGSAEKPIRKTYEEIDVEVRCKGTFQNVMSFLKKLESFPKIVGVRQMTIVPQVAQDSKSVKALETTVRIRVYVFPRTAAWTSPGQADGSARPQPAHVAPDGNPAPSAAQDRVVN
jgi:Tfp pilus assembly protein PilO